MKLFFTRIHIFHYSNIKNSFRFFIIKQSQSTSTYSYIYPNGQGRVMNNCIINKKRQENKSKKTARSYWRNLWRPLKYWSTLEILLNRINPSAVHLRLTRIQLDKKWLQLILGWRFLGEQMHTHHLRRIT